jgi:regulator of protease activity HflC (stomatin/prohibitin superfamily)
MKKLHLTSRGNAAYSAIVPIIVALAFLLFLVSGMFVVVQAGHVGVVKRFGAVQTNALPEGLHFKRPFVDVVEQIDIRLMPTNAKSTAASKDLQTVSTEVNVTYSVNGELAPLMFQRIGDTRKVAAALVEPAIQESVKAVTAQYTAEELVTKRAQVKIAIQTAIEEFIGKTLSEKDIANGVRLANVAITDFVFSVEFNKAIESKVKAEQEALRAKNEFLMRVTQAEASEAEVKLAADAKAYSTQVESEARANAIKIEAAALRDNPAIIELRGIERWDGALPKFSGSSAVPFLNLDSMTEETTAAATESTPSNTFLQ